MRQRAVRECSRGPEFGGGQRRADAHPQPALGRRRPRGPPPAPVVDLVPGPGQGHRRPEVRQREPRAGDDDGAEPRGVQRQEPHPRPALGVDDICPHIRLAERRHRPELPAARGRHVHPERHQPHPGGAVENLDSTRRCAGTSRDTTAGSNAQCTNVSSAQRCVIVGRSIVNGQDPLTTPPGAPPDLSAGPYTPSSSPSAPSMPRMVPEAESVPTVARTRTRARRPSRRTAGRCARRSRPGRRRRPPCARVGRRAPC